MGKIQRCLDADSDWDPSENSDEFEETSIINGTLCKDIREAEHIEKQVEIIE